MLQLILLFVGIELTCIDNTNISQMQHYEGDGK